MLRSSSVRAQKPASAIVCAECPSSSSRRIPRRSPLISRLTPRPPGKGLDIIHDAQHVPFTGMHRVASSAVPHYLKGNIVPLARVVEIPRARCQERAL